MKAKNGDTVSVDYTGRLADGTVFDSSEGREPLSFKLGDNQVIPGFEEAVAGMEVGEEKEVTIPSENAYGERKDELVQEVPRDHLPEEAKVGTQLLMGLPNGQRIPVTVTEMGDETAKLDLNHPLAGKELTFMLALRDVQEA